MHYLFLVFIIYFIYYVIIGVQPGNPYSEKQTDPLVELNSVVSILTGFCLLKFISQKTPYHIPGTKIKKVDLVKHKHNLVNVFQLR